MAQSYFTPNHASQSLPDLSKTSSHASEASIGKVALASDVQAAYIEQREQCVLVFSMALTPQQ